MNDNFNLYVLYIDKFMRYIKVIIVILIMDYIFYSLLDIKKCDLVYVFGIICNCSSRNVIVIIVVEIIFIKIIVNLIVFF